MKAVVIGGTGLIGSQVVTLLGQHGNQAIAAAPNTGVNTVTGEGLDEALQDADVVVDVSNSPSFADDDVLTFFESSTRNLLAAESRAGVRHHVALGVVGTERLQGSGYFRGKAAQERLIIGSQMPYSLVHATQFFEFVTAIAAAASEDGVIRLPPVLIQPLASADVARAVARTAAAGPSNGVHEFAGPEQHRLDELVREALLARQDPREVVADADAPYFGAKLSSRTLLPGPDATLFETRFVEWLGAVPA